MGGRRVAELYTGVAHGRSARVLWILLLPKGQSRPKLGCATAQEKHEAWTQALVEISPSTTGRPQWLSSSLVLLPLPGNCLLVLPEVLGASAWAKGLLKPSPALGVEPVRPCQVYLFFSILNKTTACGLKIG